MRKISIAAIMAILTVPAMADDTTNGFPTGIQFGLGVSPTSGLNGFVGYANKNFENFWWKRLGVRLDFATTSPVKSVINSAIDSALDGGVDVGDGITIDDGTASAQHIGVLVDFYPFGNTWFAGGWRLTAGYMTGKMNLTANLTGKIDGAPSDAFEFELNGTEYRYTGNKIDAFANADWKYSGPYLGTGFDLGIFRGFKLYMDAGVVFTSKTAALGLDVSRDNLQQWNGGAWVVADIPQLDDNISIATQDANDELNDIKVFPLIKLGFMYRF